MPGATPGPARRCRPRTTRVAAAGIAPHIAAAQARPGLAIAGARYAEFNRRDTPRLGCERGTLSRPPNGKAGVSANMALALEDVGRRTADHWMQMPASYEFAQARRARAGSERRARDWHG